MRRRILSGSLEQDRDDNLPKETINSIKPVSIFTVCLNAVLLACGVNGLGQLVGARDQINRHRSRFERTNNSHQLHGNVTVVLDYGDVSSFQDST